MLGHHLLVLPFAQSVPENTVQQKHNHADDCWLKLKMDQVSRWPQPIIGQLDSMYTGVLKQVLV